MILHEQLLLGDPLLSNVAISTPYSRLASLHLSQGGGSIKPNALQLSNVIFGLWALVVFLQVSFLFTRGDVAAWILEEKSEGVEQSRKDKVRSEEAPYESTDPLLRG